MSCGDCKVFVAEYDAYPAVDVEENCSKSGDYFLSYQKRMATVDFLPTVKKSQVHSEQVFRLLMGLV